MAGDSLFVWILLLCVFQASDNINVHQAIKTNSHQGNPDDLLSMLPITLPEGINPNNITVHSYTVKVCPGTREELARLRRLLRQTTARTSQLDAEAFGLRRDVRELRLQLDSCSSTASAITGSYATQIRSKLNHFLDSFESDSFLIMKIIALNWEVNTLKEKVERAANNTETSNESLALKEKTNELNMKMQQLERRHANSSLIIEIIELQTQIWNLEQEDIRRGNKNSQPNRNIVDLQRKVDKSLQMLQGSRDSAILELISVRSKVALLKRLISNRIEESRINAADYQREWRRKMQLITQKIKELSQDENNSELTREIWILQSEVQRLSQLISNSTMPDSQLEELRVILESEMKKQDVLQKELEKSDYIQAQLIMKIINLLKDVREMEIYEQGQTTSTSTATTLQSLLEAKDRENAKAQEEINELQKKLQSKREECSSLQEKFDEVKREFDQKIAELNRTGNAETALILSLINLQNEVKTLKDLISTAEDQDSVSELQRKLKEKEDELKSKTEDFERLVANPKIILTIIERQHEIQDLQKNASNATTSERLRELQHVVDGLINEIDDNENAKLTLRIITLQSRVEQLQKQLSGLETSQTDEIKKLQNDMNTNKRELQKYVDELQEKNQTNARLILEATDLHKQIRNLEMERQKDNTGWTLTLTQLRQELRTKRLQHNQDQADIETLKALLQHKERNYERAEVQVRELMRKLLSMSEECSSLQERFVEAKTEFDQKIAELNRTGNSGTALILNVISLQDDVKNLRDLISNTVDPERLSELHRKLKDKQDELNSKKEEIKSLMPNPDKILTIIELQNMIWELQKNATNGTTSDRVRELQNQVDGLISELDDKENTKLTLRIITLQSRVEQLQKQLSELETSQTDEIKKLQNDMKTNERELQKYVDELQEKNQTNARLILEATDLHKQIRNLEMERQNDNTTSTSTITKLRKQLEEEIKERSRNQAEIKDLKNKLNQTEAQCSNYDQTITDLQNDLDDKLRQLESTSDTVTSLALKVSTLTVQVEQLKKRLQNTESESKIKELQKIIDEKTKELATKTQELKERSAQPQRILQIITIQTEIEKLVNVGENETDYMMITEQQNKLNHLIRGIQDEDNENTQLMFQIFSKQDEVAQLTKQKEQVTKADQKKIKDLESELEDVRSQIKEKTQMLDSSGMRITNLSAEIMSLHKKIKPLEDEIAALREASAKKLEAFERKLNLSRRQLQDSEAMLRESDEKNSQYIMQVSELRAKLKKAQMQATQASRQSVDELEKQLQAGQKEKETLEKTNKDLKHQVEKLQMCCSDSNTQCDDLQRELRQIQEDADRLQQQLKDKDAELRRVQQDFGELTREKEDLQQQNTNLKKERQKNQALSDYLRQQLQDRKANVTKLQKALEEMQQEKQQLEDDYNNLQGERDKLEADNRDLQSKLSDVEDKVIHTEKMTFDPDTAHRRIVTSANNDEVYAAAEAQDVPDNTGRFDVVLGVLAKTGFSSGRQYWEVSVAGKRCFLLGMASESASRRGSLVYRPDNGFWTIVLNKQGQYKALDRRPVLIPVMLQPHTLGILLDYKKGMISFYDAGVRSHLYTFVGQSFRDKIYPFVNLCVEEGDDVRTPIVSLVPGSTDWIQ